MSCGLDWLLSGLEGKYFCKIWCSYASVIFKAVSGVTQGSNLGLLLFILFINDIISVFTCKFQIYADDIKIYHRIFAHYDHLFFQDNIDSVVKWASANQMPLKSEESWFSEVDM